MTLKPQVEPPAEPEPLTLKLKQSNQTFLNSDLYQKQLFLFASCENGTSCFIKDINCVTGCCLSSQAHSTEKSGLLIYMIHYTLLTTLTFFTVKRQAGRGGLMT